jgi:hypothetical protein
MKRKDKSMRYREQTVGEMLPSGTKVRLKVGLPVFGIDYVIPAGSKGRISNVVNHTTELVPVEFDSNGWVIFVNRSDLEIAILATKHDMMLPMLSIIAFIAVVLVFMVFYEVVQGYHNVNNIIPH